jgi:hypothetical protein
MRRVVLSLALFVGLAADAKAGSSPNLINGQVPNAAQWNSFFQAKQDDLGYHPINAAGDTMTGRLVTAPPGASLAGLNLTPGSVPASPVNGDLWITSAGFFAQVNGATVGALGGFNAGLINLLAYYASPGTTLSGLATCNNCVIHTNGSGVPLCSSTLPNGLAMQTPASIALISGTGLPISTGLAGIGTDVATELGVNVGTAGAFVVNGGALGTPSSATLTNATGLPLSTGVSGTLAAEQFPARTGDVTTTAGSPATTIAANAVTNAKLAQMPANASQCNPTRSLAQAQYCTGAQAVSILQFTQTAAAAVQRLLDGKIKDQVVSVRDFGALGNSNGTHLNGNDDTSAVSAAVNAAPQGNIYFPCGTYRITSTITKSTIAHYHLFGDGWCSQVYLDNTTNISLFSFTPASGCIYCIKIEGLNFLSPNTAGANVGAINLSNENRTVIQNNIFAGKWSSGVFLTLSFAPTIQGNTVLGINGTLVSSNADKSFNGARIWNNGIYSSGATNTAAGININCGGATNVSIIGNDIENNYGGIAFNACNNVDVLDNFFDGNTQYPLHWTGGSNAGYNIKNNNFTGSTTTTFGGGGATLSKVVFGANSVSALTINWSATALIFEPTNVGYTPPTPALSVCGTAPSIVGTDTEGLITTGTGSPTGCTAAFANGFADAPLCTVSSQNNVGSLTSYSVTATTISLVVSGAGGLNVNYKCVARPAG